MKAMVLNKICSLKEDKNPLELVNLPDPVPGEKQVLVKVSACGVCHTELDEIEGRTSPPRFPVVLGHEVVGRVEKKGNENLCENFRATGRDANGGYAEYTTVLEDFVYKIPDVFSDSEAAPFLCAGAIGYRSLRLTGRLGNSTTY